MYEAPPFVRWPVPESILETTDCFVAAVPWGKSRVVTVYRRVHAGRMWIRFRTWNRHRKLDVWYPTKRFFVVPIERAVELAGALCAAAGGIENREPEWLVEFQRANLEQLKSQNLSPEEYQKEYKRIVGA